MGGDGHQPTELVATLINRENSFAEGIRCAQEVDRGLLLAAAADRGRDLCRPRPAGPHAGGHRPQAGRLRRHAGDLRPAEPRLRGRALPRARARSCGSRPTASRRSSRPATRCRSARSSGSTTAIRPRATKGSTSRWSATAAARRWPGPTTARSTSWPAFPTPAPATPSATRTRSGIPYGRPFVKYTPTWPRSFMPQDQRVRDLVARMKLIPIRELIQGKRVLFCEDSIVRGTQLQRHDPAALRLRRPGSPHAAGLPAAGLRLQVPELLAVEVGAGPGRPQGDQGTRRRRRQAPGRLRRSRPPTGTPRWSSASASNWA